MRTDIAQLRQQAKDAREYLEYAVDVYHSMGYEAPYHIYRTLDTLDTIEPQLYRGNNLGQLQLILWGAGSLIALAGAVFSIYQKASADKAEAEVERQKLDMINQGKLQPDALNTDKKDTIGDTLDKVRGVLLITVAIISIVSVTNLLKEH